MFKVSSSLIVGIFCLTASAQQAPSAPASAPSMRELEAFEVGVDAAQQVGIGKNTEAAIQKRMQEEVERACSKDGCVVTTIKSNKEGWNTNFQVGQSANGNGGNNYYIGNANPYGSDQGSIGFSVQYINMHCTQQVLLPKSWAMTLYSVGEHMRDENNKPISPMGSDNIWMTKIEVELTRQLGQNPCTRQ